jgi:hypothetical protein
MLGFKPGFFAQFDCTPLSNIIWRGVAQHEGLFDFGEDSRENSGEKGVLWRDLSRILSGRVYSWDNSGENASISKCHCSETCEPLILRYYEVAEGLFAIERLKQSYSVVCLTYDAVAEGFRGSRACLMC